MQIRPGSAWVAFAAACLLCSNAAAMAESAPQSGGVTQPAGSSPRAGGSNPQPGGASPQPGGSNPQPAGADFQPGGADSQTAANPLAPLAHGELLVWVLQAPPAHTPSTANLRSPSRTPAAPTPAPRSAPAPTYQEHDAGTFGQTAGSFGRDAADYGSASSSSAISAPASGAGYRQQTSGSFGQPSSNVGTAAGDYGQPAGSFGQTSSSFGAASSSVGQTAGSFGNGLSTLAQAGVHPEAPEPNLALEPTPQVQELRQQVQAAFPDLHVRYVPVHPDDLDARLQAARDSDRTPDLLLDPTPGDGWRTAQQELSLATLRSAVFYADGVTQQAAAPQRVAVVAQGAHLAAAQAFALWLMEARSGCAGCVAQNPSASSQAAASVAVSAITHLLQGQPLGGMADPMIAAFPPQLGTGMLTDGAETLAANTPVQIELMQASSTGRLAVVALRVVASSSNVFAVAHPLVVLRRDTAGQWHVLHVSLNLLPKQQQAEREVLVRGLAAAPERSSLLRGVVQASPVDGDTRPPQPELWWDNGGGASLQVVEWQLRNGGAWADPHLYLAPDVGSRLRTQVTASFASTPATYRWRVWSIGARGEVKISSWSTLNIAQ